MKIEDAKCGAWHKIPIVLEFAQSELLYDIANRAYVHGDVLREETNPHAVHHFQDVTDDGNKDISLRFLNKAFAEVKEMLYSCTEDIVPGIYCDDSATDDTEIYRIFMGMPRTISRHSIELLKEQIHEYMVCRVLSEWALMTQPDSTAIWSLKAERLREDIKSTHNKRMRKVRIRKSVF